MEIIDLYDNKKQKLIKTMVRSAGEPADGEFKLSVHTWLLNSKGELLIQKRMIYMLHKMKHLIGKYTLFISQISQKLEFGK